MEIANSTDLGAIVRRQRKLHGLSQTELAQMLGTTRQWLSRFEQGSNDVSLGNAFAALEALEIKLLFAEPQAPSPESPAEPEDVIANGGGGGEESAFKHMPQTLELELPGESLSDNSEAVAPVSTGKPVSRFDKLRERDSLAGLSSRLNKSTSTPSHVESSDAQEYEATPVRVGKPAHYSIDDDIARIAKSTLFKR